MIAMLLYEKNAYYQIPPTIQICSILISRGCPQVWTEHSREFKTSFQRHLMQIFIYIKSSWSKKSTKSVLPKLKFHKIRLAEVFGPYLKRSLNQSETSLNQSNLRPCVLFLAYAIDCFNRGEEYLILSRFFLQTNLLTKCSRNKQ